MLCEARAVLCNGTLGIQTLQFLLLLLQGTEMLQKNLFHQSESFIHIPKGNELRICFVLGRNLSLLVR